MLEILTGLGLATASGLNAFIPLLGIGLLARFTDLIALPAGWAWLSNDWVLIIVGVLLVLELVADKVPALDHVNDWIQTVIRPTSGGIVFGAGTASSTAAIQDPASFFTSNAWVPVVIGIGIALLTHLTKSSTRAAANVVTAGAAAPILSVGEDAISVGLLFSAILVPLFVLVMLAMLGVLAWLLFRSFKRVRDARAARSGPAAPPVPPAPGFTA